MHFTEFLSVQISTFLSQVNICTCQRVRVANPYGGGGGGFKKKSVFIKGDFSAIASL